MDLDNFIFALFFMEDHELISKEDAYEHIKKYAIAQQQKENAIAQPE